MDIIPLNNKKSTTGSTEKKKVEDYSAHENLIQNTDIENAKPSQHVYPVTVPDEATGKIFFQNII